jgi:ferredoxin
MNTISFSTLEKLFDSEKWDIGYLSPEAMKQCINSPIKVPLQTVGKDLSKHYNYPVTNAIVLAKYGMAYDYGLYEDAATILVSNRIADWEIVYLNYKIAAILGGIGVRARNSLIYNYKFGFESHYVVIMFKDTIVDVPSHLRVNRQLWHKCENCYDCVNACPVGAIHGKEEPYWVDLHACDTFIGLGSEDRPDIPSVRDFWHKNVRPDLSDEEVKQLRTKEDFRKKFGKPEIPWSNGYSFDGNMLKKDGVPVAIDMCRECTAQPRCSKYTGKYPYGQLTSDTDYTSLKNTSRIIKIMVEHHLEKK